MPADPTLSYADVKAAVAGRATAFRLALKLEAVSPKVFPPTYAGGKCATEERNRGGQRVRCVLLDSVPSQTNRMELALQNGGSTLDTDAAKKNNGKEVPLGKYGKPSVVNHGNGTIVTSRRVM